MGNDDFYGTRSSFGVQVVQVSFSETFKFARFVVPYWRVWSCQHVVRVEVLGWGGKILCSCMFCPCGLGFTFGSFKKYLCSGLVTKPISICSSFSHHIFCFYRSLDCKR